MLDMGFIPDIEQHLQAAAAAPADLVLLGDDAAGDHRAWSDSSSRIPVRIEAAPPATTANTITQRFRYCPTAEDWDKREVLRELIARRERQERHHLLQPQARRGDPAQVAAQARLQRRRPARRHGPDEPHGDARQAFRDGAHHAAGRERRGRPRSRHPRRQPHLQLRRAVAVRRLRAPHRPHGPRRQGRHARPTLVTPDELKSLKDIEKMLGEPVVWIGDAPSAEDFAEGGKKRRGRGGRAGAQRGRGRGPAPSARGGDKGRRDEHRVHGRAPEQRAEGRSERPERAAEPRRQDAGRPEATAQRPHTQQPQEPRRQEAQAPRPPRQEQPRREQPRQEQPQQESRRQEGQRQEHRQEFFAARPSRSSIAKPKPATAMAISPVPSVSGSSRAVAAKASSSRHARALPTTSRPSCASPSSARSRSRASSRCLRLGLRGAGQHPAHHGIAQHEVVVERRRGMHGDDRD